MNSQIPYVGVAGSLEIQVVKRVSRGGVFVLCIHAGRFDLAVAQVTGDVIEVPCAPVQHGAAGVAQSVECPTGIRDA